MSPNPNDISNPSFMKNAFSSSSQQHNPNISNNIMPVHFPPVNLQVHDLSTIVTDNLLTLDDNTTNKTFTPDYSILPNDWDNLTTEENNLYYVDNFNESTIEYRNQ